MNINGSKSQWVAAFVILLLGFTAYANVLSYPFVHDDIVFIQQNPHISRWADWRSAFLSPQWPNDPAVIVPYWRPVLEITNRFQYMLWGLKPGGYHFFNILLHSLNSIFVFLILKRIIPNALMGFTLALVFLLHPVQSEAVACVSGISNLLFACCGLFSLLFFALSREYAKARLGFLWLIFSYGAYFKALLSKEQAIVFLFLIMLYALMYPTKEKRSAAVTWLPLAGFAFISALYLSLRRQILGATAVDLFANKHELLLRLKAVAETVYVHLKTLLWPSDLHYYRSLDVLNANTVYWAIIFLILTVVVLLVQNMDKANRKLALFGIAWFVLSLLPTLNIFPLIIEYSKISIAEHFLYLPMLGFFIFVGTCLESYKHIFSQPEKYRATGIIWIVLILAGAVLTRQQNTYWRAEVPLFERTLKFENIGRVRILLGRAYYFNKQYPQSVAEYTKALAIMEGYRTKAGAGPAAEVYKGFIKGIHFDLAHVYDESGDIAGAVSEYEAAIRLDPNDAVLYNNLATVFMRLGDTAKVGELLEKAVALDPKNLEVMNNLAIVYIQQNKPNQAMLLFQRVLAIDPHFQPARQNMELLLGPE